MNLKTIIPICITIIIIGGSFGIVLFEYYNQGPIILVDESINLCPICDDSDETLHEVLRGCELKANNPGQDIDLVDKHYMNSTHHIDNNLCEWHEKDHSKHPLNTDYTN